MLRYGAVLVFIFPLFPCSKLTGHEVTHIPTVTVGPYQPWDWDTNLLTRLRQPYQAEGTQTNIATGYKPTVEIITSNLATGKEVGRTAWSGPGTLTLSALTSSRTSNTIKRASPAYTSPLNSPYLSHLRQSPTEEEVEVFSVPPEHREDRRIYSPPVRVLGSVCSSPLHCSPALRAVCAPSRECQPAGDCQSGEWTCQCPPQYYQHINTFKSGPHGGSHHLARSKRTYKYYEECRYDL